MLFSDRPIGVQRNLFGWYRPKFSWFGSDGLPFDVTQPTGKNGDGFETTLPQQIAPKTPRTINRRESLQIQTLKSEMLKLIEDLEGQQRPAVWYKITSARDRECLWELRVDLMDVLAKARGEQVAMQLMASVTNRFNAAS